MKVLGLLLAAAVTLSTSARAEVRITNDEGGSVNQYFARYQTIRDSGERVVIDGLCVSACTLVLGIVPPDRVCVTDGAMLGFHAAWRPNAFGGRSTATDQTQRMLESYPASVRRWLSRQGGLSSHMVFAHGRTLNAMVRRCPPQAQARLDY
jgi:hypothetical protein